MVDQLFFQLFLLRISAPGINIGLSVIKFRKCFFDLYFAIEILKNLILSYMAKQVCRIETTESRFFFNSIDLWSKKCERDIEICQELISSVRKKQSKKYRNCPFKLISFAGQSRSISWTRDSEEQCSGQLIQMTSLPSVASPSGWSYFKLFSVKWNHFGMTMKGFAHILVYITQILILSMLRYINCSLDLQGVH